MEILPELCGETGSIISSANTIANVCAAPPGGAKGPVGPTAQGNALVVLHISLGLVVVNWVLWGVRICLGV